MSLNTPKPPKRKFLTMLGITFGGLGSFGLKAIRNRCRSWVQLPLSAPYFQSLTELLSP